MDFLDYDGPVAQLTHALSAVGCAEEYCIFGSVSLKIRGIIDRPIDDVDVAVSKAAWGRIFAARPGWIVETPNQFDPPILTFPMSHPLHLFYEWADDRVTIDIPKLVENAEIVDGIRVAPIEEVLRHKNEALSYGTRAVQKHVPDIAAIERFLALPA